MTETKNLVPPHGGELVDLIVDPKRAGELETTSRDFASLSLFPRQLCDLELLLIGAFSPLTGFMCRNDYESVCSSMRLANGTLWPMPINLDVTEEFAKTLKPGSSVALRDAEGFLLAILHVEEVWKPDLMAEAQSVFATTDAKHPSVSYLINKTNPWYIGGRIEGIRIPKHYDFLSLRRTPAELREDFTNHGWEQIVAFQTRNPMHRAHFELTLRAAERVKANILVHPVVGLSKPGDVDYYTRVRCYQAIMERYPENTARLALLPLAMRMGGPKEAMWHAIIRKNYGCTHFIVGRDHAGPGADSTGKPFYQPYEAQELLKKHEDELGIHIVPFNAVSYVEDTGTFLPEDEVPSGSKISNISGTQLRDILAKGGTIPEWFTFPEVATELQRSHPPRHKQGFTIFFTGLSGAGKSTIANALMVRILAIGGRPVTLLDGDVVRKHLSSELGFSKEHRDLNILRIGFVASEITKNGGIAICAPIAPYDQVRKQVREMISPTGGLVLVHISTSLFVCEQRDAKGLYAKARAGLIPQFTGISDPYEEPTDAEIVIDAATVSPEDAAEMILAYLGQQGYLSANSGI